MKLHIILLVIILTINGSASKRIHFEDVDNIIKTFNNKLSETCADSIQKYIEGLFNNEKWALEMFDSTTKLPDGLLYGNTNQLGNFDECINLDIPKEYPFTSKFCRANLILNITNKINLNKHLKNIVDLNYLSSDKGALIPSIPYVKWSFCLTSVCNSTEIEEIIENLIPPLLLLYFNIDVKIDADVNPNECNLPDIQEYPPIFWVFISLEITVLLIVIISTVIDFNVEPKKPNDYWITQSFSLKYNIPKLFDIKHDKNSFPCLHGIRVISMLFIFMAHRYSEETAGAVSNSVEIPQFTVKPINQIILNAMVDVDTFFFISGFLGCYVLLREINNRKGHFSPVIYYIYRYIRLTAPLIVVLFYYIAVFPYMGRGPLWKQIVITNTDPCKENWWTLLLYVQNYVGTPNMCITQSWYLAVDMQLSWILPIIVLLMIKFPKETYYFMFLIVIGSFLAPFGVTYVNYFPWSQTLNIYESLELTIDYFEKVYWPTHMRMTPYLIGILLGYYIHKTQKKPIKLSKWIVGLGWILSISVGLAVIFTLSIPYQEDYEYNRLEAAFYAGFHRLGWSLMLSWIIFACIKGYGGIANSIFSWKLFLPLSRLCYSAYLVQFIIILYDVGIGRASNHFSHFNSFHTFLGDQPMIFGLAFCIYICIEAPTMNLLRPFFRPHSYNTEKSNLDLPNTDSENIIDKTPINAYEKK